ncbi:MAG: ATP-binding protein [Bacteroidales bacterium]|nr:ATP-binding protein [Bacteroidales bacterium]
MHLEDMEHLRLRPTMYIGKLGDGSSQDDGIYVLIKEVIDNSIDEFTMGFGKQIEVNVSFQDKVISVRDHGRGIPLEKVVEVVSRLNTGGKYDNKAFQKSIGLNGVGTKAVNALSSYFTVQAIRNGETKIAEFSEGKLIKESDILPCDEDNGTYVEFVPDPKCFGNYHYINDYIEKKLWNYVYLNKGLTIRYNGQRLYSKNGLIDLLENNMEEPGLYPIIHIHEGDFECAFTHMDSKYSKEEYYSFVNGQHTPDGGTHQAAFREGIVKTIRDFYKKDYDPSDVRQGIICALSIRVQEPEFRNQTKTNFSSEYMEPSRDGKPNESPSVRGYIKDVLARNLDNYLHINATTAEAMQARIVASEKERKEIAEIKKANKDKTKKVSLNNRKLRDCRVHYNTNNERRLETTIFITEGDSASGSITKSRDVNTQAVFSLRGKPKNCYGKSKAIVYQNKEFNLLHSALDIDDGLENLRYNNVVIATDADHDGMHIRMLLLAFFLQFFPDLIKTGHVYILQTPLFRVRNKQKTLYCYTEEERVNAINSINNAEITRFKGLGEISADEFKNFIGKDMRLDPVIFNKDFDSPNVLRFYMGKNTPERKKFLMDNLRTDDDND